jgi:hypothetical protein
MKSVIRWMLPAVALACTSATPALAQQMSSEEVAYWKKPVRAPYNAFELTLGTGYTQGFGRLGGGSPHVDQVAQEGMGFELGGGYRISPRWSLGLSGQYQEFRPATSLAGTNTGVGTRGFVAGANGTYHFNPEQSVDPFVQFGAGYRLLWEMHQTTLPDTLRHGFQLARLAVGADLRMTEDVSVGPVVGADLTAFSFLRTGSINEAPNISNWGLSTFVFAGLQGRFDMGGVRRGGAGEQVVARR